MRITWIRYIPGRYTKTVVRQTISESFPHIQIRQISNALVDYIETDSTEEAKAIVSELRTIKGLDIICPELKSFTS